MSRALCYPLRYVYSGMAGAAGAPLMGGELQLIEAALALMPGLGWLKLLGAVENPAPTADNRRLLAGRWRFIGLPSPDRRP
jgi:hypothetical protein